MTKALNFNIFHPDCPARSFFDKFADKWILLIIYRLHGQSQHFNELKKSLTGISPKVLSQKLKILERDGFISRTIHENNVIRVEYALTPLGIEFAGTALVFKNWAEENMQHVIRAQRLFDASQAIPESNLSTESC
ncbi:transcriptional regulator [Acinetobacter sp. WCHAc060033]|uniref:winged helix-turn-helix transcriptional regulator n=1 Tax=Acinetobacter sp. WCHAc060033 TaxID=2518624 RepID=UPI00102326F1|nr:helix-turn-helix domain-containing protein [Acinetobacter sp. WCHAc060033]RZG79572.1 transcriptional regulator [Acinetobacter sp. WCHAc060033]